MTANESAFAKATARQATNGGGGFVLLEKELVFDVVGCAMEVLNTLGHGLREKTYENPLCVEMEFRSLRFSRQMQFPVVYRDRQIDVFQPDLIVDNRIILELKSVSALADEHRGQLINYLRITGLQVGLLLNFAGPKLVWERLVLENSDSYSR